MQTWHDVKISLPFGTTGELRTTCPQCSSSRRKSSDPCLAVNADHGTWLCHHCGWKGTLKRRQVDAPHRVPTTRSPRPDVQRRAEDTTLDVLYRGLLAALPLTPAHHQALRHRGLTDVAIRHRGYRTLPLGGRAALAHRLVSWYGADRCVDVPGFYMAERDGQRW